MSAEIIPLHHRHRRPPHAVRLACLDRALDAAAAPPLATAHQALVEIVGVMSPYPVDPALADAFANALESALWERGFMLARRGDEAIR